MCVSYFYDFEYSPHCLIECDPVRNQSDTIILSLGHRTGCDNRSLANGFSTRFSEGSEELQISEWIIRFQPLIRGRCVISEKMGMTL